MENSGWERATVEAAVEGVACRIAAMHRPGRGRPMLFLHGFGSTKEDYADIAFDPRLKDRALVAYDAPGCGETHCETLFALSIPFLRAAARAVIAAFELEKPHLMGHSMGGLTGLTLASEWSDGFSSFTSIEGNVAPEDCFLSREILDFPNEDPKAFLGAFAGRAWRAAAPSSALFASTLPHKVRAEAVAPIFRSMVTISDTEPLIEKLFALPYPTQFVHGDWNAGLSYLERLRAGGTRVTEIPASGHFPMYSNAPALWDALATFVEDVEGGA